MLIQMPRGSPDRPGAQNAQEGGSFEEALRRDLASAPVVSYDPMLGGWSKRAIDLVLTLATAPLWLPALVVLAVWAKLRHPAAPVLQAPERIGYGGRAFRRLRLRLKPASAKIERLHAQGEPGLRPANDWDEMTRRAEGPPAKWRRALERLPQLLNVLIGDMALVGPTPLSREDLEPLKTAKRYYLSARPGVVGVNAIADADEEEAGQYKIYARSWSHWTDALILWDALSSWRDRGALWQPGLRLLPAKQGERRVIVRRRPART
jgi:lipopolysaccharide/colanic/teichoic acid biosynthesis glycosyltransferase